MISPFITSLAIGVMFTVSTVTLFFGGVLAIEWFIRKIHGVEKRC